MSCHFNPSSSLTRSPVTAARKTMVRQGSVNSDNSALSSLASSTSGTLLRFALCRTDEIGFLSNHVTHCVIEERAHDVPDFGFAPLGQGQTAKPLLHPYIFNVYQV